MLYNLFENRDFVSVFAVALLAEGVDRNFSSVPSRSGALVALLAEGVDRNKNSSSLSLSSACVALLAEGVDRNPFGTVLYIEGVGSPSSRRAWIEID